MKIKKNSKILFSISLLFLLGLLLIFPFSIKAEGDGCCIDSNDNCWIWTAGGCAKEGGEFHADDPDCTKSCEVGKANACDDPFYQKKAEAAKKGGLFKNVSANCVVCGVCSLCDFLNVANEIARIIFTLFGGVAFLMFIWGGVSFIIALGNPEKIQAAKSILKNAVIGIIIIVFAWQLVHVVIGALVTSSEQAEKGEWKAKLFGKPWDNPCTQSEGEKKKE